MRFVLLANILLLVLSPVKAYAGLEQVYVAKVMVDDKAIVVRKSGKTYLIEKGNGCDSLYRYEGRNVVIVSYGVSLSVGSSLRIPGSDEECRIWSSEEIGACKAGHWILNILGDGEVVVLEDRSFWRVAPVDAEYTSRWFLREQVFICGNAMINTSSGEKVRVKRFR